MNSILLFLESASLARLGVTLIHSLWQIAILALLFKIVLTAVNQRAARTRYWTAIAFLLAALVAPAVTFSVLPDRFVAVESQTLDVAILPGEFDREDTDTALPSLPLLPSQPEPLAENFTPSENDTASSTKPTAAAQPIWGPVLTALNSAALLCSPYATLLWFFGVLLFSFRPFTSLVRIFRLKSNGLSMLDEKFTSQVERLSQRLYLKRSVEIAKSTLVQVPTVVGFFKPLILLPASSLSGLTAAELEAILLHELAHLKRYDDIFVLFQSFVETLLFFHPAVWWFSSVASSERENCCDDLATKAIGCRAPLASALLSLVNQNNLTTQSLSATGGNVSKRIRRLAEVTPAKSGASRWLSSLFSLLVITLIGVYAGSTNSLLAETTTSVFENDPPISASQLETITKINSASFAAGTPGTGVDGKQRFKISDFSVVGSDKLVVSVASEIGLPFETNVKFAGRKLERLVQTAGTTTAGIYYLDNPSKVAKQGDILIYYSKGKGKASEKLTPNGVAIYAVALAGTAPGFTETAAGTVGEPFANIKVPNDHSYVIAASASDDLKNVKSGSLKYIVTCDAPFTEVGAFNGLGNEIGSALAATAEIVDCPAEEVTARFLGLSDRRNRETVVVAAFAPAEK